MIYEAFFFYFALNKSQRTKTKAGTKSEPIFFHPNLPFGTISSYAFPEAYAAPEIKDFQILVILVPVTP